MILEEEAMCYLTMLDRIGKDSLVYIESCERKLKGIPGKRIIN